MRAVHLRSDKPMETRPRVVFFPLFPEPARAPKGGKGVTTDDRST
jgi:hypothetical protein